MTRCALAVGRCRRLAAGTTRRRGRGREAARVRRAGAARRAGLLLRVQRTDLRILRDLLPAMRVLDMATRPAVGQQSAPEAVRVRAPRRRAAPLRPLSAGRVPRLALDPSRRNAEPGPDVAPSGHDGPAARRPPGLDRIPASQPTRTQIAIAAATPLVRAADITEAPQNSPQAVAEAAGQTIDAARHRAKGGTLNG